MQNRGIFKWSALPRMSNNHAHPTAFGMLQQLFVTCTANENDIVRPSIGTNDIRNCTGRGVGHLRGHLKRLVKTTQGLFPEAKLFIQSVLPHQAQNPWTVMNVLAMNALIKSCCYEEKVYYVNSFSDFLLPGGRTNTRLFVDPVHPTHRGTALIASRIIRIIHPRVTFNPEMY